MTEMPWALGHGLSTSLTFEVPVNRTHTGVHQTAKFRSVAGLVHDFWMFDLDDGVGFLKKRQENFSETRVKEKCSQSPLVKESRTEPPSLCE